MGWDSFEDTLKTSVTGNIETAYLIIVDKRKKAKKAAEASPESLTPQTGAANLLVASEAAQELARSSAFPSSGNSAAGTTEQTPEQICKRFTLQFNPKELQIYSTGLPLKVPNAQPTGVQDFVDVTEGPRVEMTVPLLFDAVNNCDAFMFDRLTTAMTSPLSAQMGLNVKTMLAANKKGENGEDPKEWSVQPQVEAFIAAIRDENTRLLEFHWTDFVFKGTITTVMAQYTMFSPSGKPVRATVTIRIRHSMAQADLQPWYEAFDTLLGEDGTTSFAGNQKHSNNLLNMKL